MFKFKKGMVFGVFDGLHAGHKFFIESAAAKCEQLVVVVARTEVVEMLKGRAPKFSEAERIEAIHTWQQDFQVVLGDTDIRTWGVVKTHKPNSIFLGYDQKGMGRALEGLGIAHEYLEPHKPDTYKSSILNK